MTPEGRRRWVVFAVITVAVAVILLLGAYLVTRPGQRPMFESLSDRFEGIFRSLRGKGRLGEAEVDEVLREIRLALLEADVNFAVVRGLVARIRERTVGAEVSQALNPAQQVIDIVHQ